MWRAGEMAGRWASKKNNHSSTLTKRVVCLCVGRATTMPRRQHQVQLRFFLLLVTSPDPPTRHQAVVTGTSHPSANWRSHSVMRLGEKNRIGKMMPHVFPQEKSDFYLTSGRLNMPRLSGAGKQQRYVEDMVFHHRLYTTSRYH